MRCEAKHWAVRKNINSANKKKKRNVLSVESGEISLTVYECGFCLKACHEFCFYPSHNKPIPQPLREKHKKQKQRGKKERRQTK